MRKYECWGSRFAVIKDTIHIFPTIVIALNDYWYAKPNFAIEVHFLCWHGKIMWGKRR